MINTILRNTKRTAMKQKQNAIFKTPRNINKLLKMRNLVGEMKNSN